jgi:uncharacterized protein
MFRSFVILVLVVLVSCKPKKNEPAPEIDFRKQALLINLCDEVILPNYVNFDLAMDSLVSAYNTFKISGSQSDLTIVKQKLHSSYLKYHRISPYEFGPAESVIVRMNYNVFPTDTVQILVNISTGSYILTSAANADAKGFPALDYLFNSRADASILQLFASTSNYKQYVADVLAEMSSKIKTIIGSWNSSYRNTFVNSLSTDIGSSIGFLVNQLNFEMDYIKNAKVGIPLGKKTLGIPCPDKCESYYAGHSVEYALETLKTIENMYLGRSLSGNNGLGFDDYLDHLGAEYNGGSLNDAIIAQFALAKSKLAAIPNPLSTQVTANAPVVDAAYVELMKLLVLLKTDMPSSLGVIITYQDGDGD